MEKNAVPNPGRLGQFLTFLSSAGFSYPVLVQKYVFNQNLTETKTPRIEHFQVCKLQNQSELKIREFFFNLHMYNVHVYV